MWYFHLQEPSSGANIKPRFAFLGVSKVTWDQMEIYTIPYDHKFIIYRPLVGLAFLGNKAMRDQALGIAQERELTRENKASEWYDFLASIGFLRSDPDLPMQQAATAYCPTVAVLCMTNACNLRCIYCYADGGNKSTKHLPIEMGRQAIDICHQNALNSAQSQFTVSFHGGGEPTLPFDRFTQLVQYSRQKELPCRIEVTSNGYWDKHKTNWILKHVDSISLSFDGLPQIQNKQRPSADGSDTYDTLMNTIESIECSKIDYGIRLTITDTSINSLPENIAFLCKNTDCRVFQVEPAFDIGRAQCNDQGLKSIDRFADAFVEAFDIAYHHARHMYYSGARPWLTTDRFCGAFDKALAVTPEGKLTSCYEVSSSDHPFSNTFFFGDLNNSGEMSLNMKNREDFQQKLSQRRDLCRDCFCYWHCAGDCPAKIFGNSPDSFLTFSKRCKLNQQITKYLLLYGISQGHIVNPHEFSESA